MGFGIRLKRTLDCMEITVSELSRASGVPQSTLYSIISKDSDNVSLERVSKIEKALGATPGNAIYESLHNDNSELYPDGMEYHTHMIDEKTGKYCEITSYDVLNEIPKELKPYRLAVREWAESKEGYTFEPSDTKRIFINLPNIESFMFYLDNSELLELREKVHSFLDSLLENARKNLNEQAATASKNGVSEEPAATAPPDHAATQPRSGLTGTQAAADPATDHTKEG